MEKKEVSCQDQDRIRKIIQSIEDDFFSVWKARALGGPVDENIFEFDYYDVEWILGLPDTGTPEVDFLKGVFFGILKDDAQKEYYLKSAAEEGLPIAQYYYGQLGEDQKIEWIEKAASQDYTLAMWLLGNYYYAKNNKDLAFYWYNRAADQGNEMAQTRVGRMCQFGEGTEVNIDKAIEFYTKACEKDYPVAQNNLGILLLEKGLDADKGVCCLTQAGKTLPYSLNKLGYFYEYGITVEKDIEKANMLYRQSADRGWGEAQINLGINLILGNGLEKNVSEGITLIKKAADAGDPAASYMMGLVNINGFNELKKNYSKAYSYFSKIKDHPIRRTYNDGIGYLATLLYFGLGVPSDRDGALELFKSINVDMSSTSEDPLWLKELSLCSIIDIDETSPVSSEVIQLNNSYSQLLRLVIECIKGMSFPDFYNFYREIDVDYERLMPRRDDLWRCMKEYKGDLWEVLEDSGLKNAGKLMDAVEKDDHDMFNSYYEVYATEIPEFSYIFCSWHNYVENRDETSKEQDIKFMKLQKKIIAAGKVKPKQHNQFYYDTLIGSVINVDLNFTHIFDINQFSIKSIILISYGIISYPGFYDQDQGKVKKIRDMFESQLFEKLRIVKTVESWINPSTNKTKVSSGRGRPKGTWLNIGTEFLIPTMLIERGIERVNDVTSFPTGEIPEQFEKEFSAMCEFLAFDEGIRLPFFKILNCAVERKYVALLNTFELKKVEHILTHKEAFSFLCLLGQRKTREILEASNFASNIFNSLLKSVEEENVDVFDRSLSEGDYSEFLKKLWMLRYVVLGIDKPTTIMGYMVSRENRWIAENPCHFCFERYTTKEWEYYKEDKIKTLAGINVRPRRLPKVYRKAEKDDVLNKNILSSEDTIVSGKYYPAWIEGLKNNDSQYGQYNKDIEIYDTSRLTSICADMICSMLTAVGRTNTESVSSLLGVEKASIHYKKLYYVEDIDDYLKYILVFTHRMLEIYKYVKDVLEKDVKDCLLSLMKHSVYTDFVCEDISYLSITVPDNQRQMSSQPDEGSQSTSPQDTIKIDRDKEHKKWFAKVRNSKIPSEQKDKDRYMYDCLNRLFDELCNDDCLDPDKENRDIFIYRFSGFNGQYPPDRKILWKGKNLFLGYIARCLLSDKINEPEGFDIINSVFLSKSEKKINCASAKNEIVDNFEKKNKLHSDFIKAVELLRKCGFVNVEFTSSRTKQSGDFVS